MVSQGAVWFYILVIFNGLTLDVLCARNWGNKQRYPSNKIPNYALNPSRGVVRRKIVQYHNFFRTKVRPTASNMLLMSWHSGAARQAQRYAEKCRFLQHNDASENTVPHLGTCGQNLFVSSHKTPWFYGIKSWFIEYKNFTFGSPKYDLHAIGHYTQMVWATSHKVGCGVAYCSGGPWGNFYNYVCHYCPGGNIVPIVQHPYKKGKPCGDCPHNCAKGKLCTNYCYARDVFNNCAGLVRHSNTCKQGNCNATCKCGNKRIHRNYPF